MFQAKLFCVVFISAALIAFSGCSQASSQPEESRSTLPSSLSTSPTSSVTPPAANNPPPSTSENQTKSTIETKPTVVTKNLCEIITAKDVSDIMGTPVTADNSFTTKNSTALRCRYRDKENNGPTLIVNMDSNNQSAKSGFESAVSYMKEYMLENQTEMQVTDVGEQNFAWSNGVMTQLNSYKGNAWLTISVTKTGSTPEERLELAKKIATKTFEKLE